MVGERLFKQMAAELMLEPQISKLASVNAIQYQQWKKQFTFDAIKFNARYGQSFCEAFHIGDNLLFYERDPERADIRIRNFYLV